MNNNNMKVGTESSKFEVVQDVGEYLKFAKESRETQ